MNLKVILSEQYKRAKNKKYNLSCILLGMLFFAMGVNGFFEIEKITFSPRGEFFLGYLEANAWLWPMINFIQVVAGLLLLLRSYVPLAILLLGPIITNILAFHICLDLVRLPYILAMTFAYLYVAYNHRGLFKRFLKKR